MGPEDHGLFNWISRVRLRRSQPRQGVLGVVEEVSRVRVAASRSLRIISRARVWGQITSRSARGAGQNLQGLPYQSEKNFSLEMT
jgi:hypothetical protein